VVYPRSERYAHQQRRGEHLVHHRRAILRDSREIVVAGRTFINPLVAVTISITILGAADTAPPLAVIALRPGRSTTIAGIILCRADTRHHSEAHRNGSPKLATT
jgi:hypothetical protein